MTPNRAEIARFNRLAKPQPNGCWTWTGTDGTRDGYGKFRPSPGKPAYMAHRWAYEAFTGPIPDGMQIDHRCHTDDSACPGGPGCPHRRCVNPAHLEAVTASENTTRQRHAERLKTECPKGHPYEGTNLILGADGKRHCRECDIQRKRLSRQRARSSAALAPEIAADQQQDLALKAPGGVLHGEELVLTPAHGQPQSGAPERMR